VLELSQGIRVSLDADYNGIGKLQYICNEMGIDIICTEYMENVHMEVVVENSKYALFVQKITDAFSGKTEIVEIGQCSFGRNEKNGIILL
jgi:putative IMPACT (imprinted ancient) family translation regulator